jgi:hypothetical protein
VLTIGKGQLWGPTFEIPPLEIRGNLTPGANLLSCMCSITAKTQSLPSSARRLTFTARRGRAMISHRSHASSSPHATPVIQGLKSCHPHMLYRSHRPVLGVRHLNQSPNSPWLPPRQLVFNMYLEVSKLILQPMWWIYQE